MIREMSLVMVKPELITRADEVYDYFDNLAQKVGRTRAHSVSRNEIYRFYAEAFYRHRKTMKAYLDYFVGKPVDLSVYAGERGIIDKFRKILGDTDPKKAEKGTIRADLCNDSLELAIAQNRAVLNGAHASASFEEFFEEFDAFKKHFDQNIIDFVRNFENSIVSE